MGPREADLAREMDFPQAADLGPDPEPLGLRFELITSEKERQGL